MDPKDLPKTGNIILVSDEQKPVMAFRVLKTEEDTGELIGKRVRRYDTTGELSVNQPYTEIEKIADLVSPPPPEPNQYNPNARPELDPNAQKNLAKINNATGTQDSNAPPLLDGGPSPTPAEASVPPMIGSNGTPANTEALNPVTSGSMDVEKFDNDLDSSTSPHDLNQGHHRQAKKESTDEEIPSEMLEVKNDLEVEERAVLWPFKNMVGIEAGSYRNTSNFSFAGATSNSGFSGYYSHTLNRNVFIEHSSVQDSINFESGFAYYSRTNFTGNNDSYTLLPLRAELRYDIYLSEAWALSGYVGLQYNFLLGTDNVDTKTYPVEQQAIDALEGPQATLGLAVFYNIGPQWYLRADLGWDRLALGLSVKW